MGNDRAGASRYPGLLESFVYVALAAVGCSDTSTGPPGGDSSESGGATSTGGSAEATGGAGAATGGETSGGNATGGAIASGGLGTGGAATGGQSTGGAFTGGVSTGGVPTGGVSTGGTEPTGGIAAGGTEPTGGTATGGTEPTGGTATGGTEQTGGTATGGAATGGAPAGGSSGAVPSAGCGKTPTLTSGARTISSGGQDRSFILRIPEPYDNDHPHRLVFAFHWNGGTMDDIDGGGTSGAVWSYYGLQAQAENSTIFVAPQGNNNGWANPGGADLNFVDDMIAQIEGDLCVDTTRIFALGFSYGGGMSYELACARADVFRAVAVYSGAQLSGCDGGNDPIAYLGIHGISDGTCTISGGRALRDRFVNNNGCTAQDPPEPSAGSLTHTCTTYEGCNDGYPVEWCAFDGGHTPGMVDGGGDDGAETWTKEETWKFFTQF